MGRQKTERKWLRQERLFRHEAPVDGPLVEERSCEFKRAPKVAEALLPERVTKKDLFSLAFTFLSIKSMT